METDFYYNINNIALKDFGISPEILKISEAVSEEIAPILRDIEQIAEYNQLKVLAAMKRAYLSEYHLYDSTGYGYNDTGRETIEEPFCKFYLLLRTIDNIII
jgi:cystathionine beta-lyase family protein involved in aluminum resistance